MSAPNPGALPQEQAPASAKIIWGIRTDGQIVPVKVADDGTLAVGATVSSEVLAEATAADPAYTEGQDAPLSQTREGYLRVLSKPAVAGAGTAEAASRVTLASDDPAVALLGTGPSLRATSDLTGLRINNAAASGDTALVSATASQTTRVHRMKLSVAGACIVQIRDGATVLEAFNFAGVGGGIVLDFSERPWYITTANTALNLNVSVAVQVDGRLEYVKS